jgi:hypothetical protein
MKIAAKFFNGDDGKTRLFCVMRNIFRPHAVEKKRRDLLPICSGGK